jgi:hypothetical protein
VSKDVPTSKEGGFPEFPISGWQAAFAPNSTPQAMQAKLHDAPRKALDDPASSKRLLVMDRVLSAHRKPSKDGLKAKSFAVVGCQGRGCGSQRTITMSLATC